MSANKIFLRYYPPGLAINYRTTKGIERLRHFDLLDLDPKADIEPLADRILLQTLAEAEENPSPTDEEKTLQSRPVSGRVCNSQNTFSALKQALSKLQAKLREPVKKKFYLHKCHTSHILPLTNVCFDRSGEMCLTGSYDRTCHIINTQTAEVEHILTGHDNVVFSVGFNHPHCDKVVTSSFDNTAKVWSTSSGQCLCTFYGHTAELVAAEFHPLDGAAIATASMDGTARIYDVETAQELHQLTHHGAEVIAARYNRDGQMLLTGSFDHTAVIWDVRSKRWVLASNATVHTLEDLAACSVCHQLRGHSAELSNCVWNFAGSLIATGSLDFTARIWDIRRLDRELYLPAKHGDEVLDVSFDAAGRLLATCSSDCTARVWDLEESAEQLEMLSLMAGHTDEVSKVCFSPSGCMMLTASADNTARLWFTESGMCSQVLTGHDGEVFSCAYSYSGDAILTASKDNTCRFWR
ncbi:hypothetical protein KR018_006993 [Drosophila ironensis]|nr:hypothetical protein KR018_006993 [Drosophila ironensis]